jgi:excisionase family DNA binding protein
MIVAKSNNNNELKFFTTNEIAEMLKMNVQVIARKLKYGELVGYKIGKDWRVREADLMEWLDKHSNKTVMNPGQKIIERFMSEGRFKTLPVQRKKRRYILEYILQQFELNRVYPEKEVNELISGYHDDYCRVRREFVDEGMMSRKDGKYRRNVSYIFAK